MSTAQAVLDALKAFDLKSEGHNKYRCNSPLRVGANSHSFSLVIDDDEHGAWNDFVANEGGSLYDLATKLNIKLPERAQAVETKRPFKDLAEYAQAHGVSADVFVAAGWNAETVTYQNRPALTFKTQTGSRWRFIDGEAPRYKSTLGYQRCWYGLRRAVTMTVDTWQPLVICNGEPSTVVAQHFKVAACAVTGGEKGNIPAALVDELKAMYQGAVIIALDCDNTGREQAEGMLKTLQDAGYTDVSVVDLGLTDGGDLADFCQLYTTDSASKLFDLSASVEPKKAPVVKAPGSKLVKRSDVLKRYEDRVVTPPAAEPILFPLTVLHEFGGMAKVMKPGKLAAVVGVSGTGKTSMLETMMDSWLRMGKNILIWSPEWDPDEMFADRAIQRYGGSKAEDIYMHEMYMAEKSQGYSKQYGAALHEHTIDKNVQLSKELDMWPGEAVSIDDKTLTVQRLVSELPGMLKELDDHYHALVIDYAQLMNALDSSRMSMYETLMQIKAACTQNGLVGLIASQTTKQDARNANKHAELLDASSARFVNDDPFNLFVTLNLEKDETTGRLLNTGILNVTKNSLGRRGKVRVGVNFEYLAWIDKKDINQSFAEGQ